MAADITIFDADNMTDRSSYADSSHFPTGVVHVLVNGILTLENSELTGHPAGRALYRQGSRMSVSAGMAGVQTNSSQ